MLPGRRSSHRHHLKLPDFAALEFSLIDGDSLALLPDVLRLPSYAAVALERTATPTPEAPGEVEQFALGP